MHDLECNLVSDSELYVQLLWVHQLNSLFFYYRTSYIYFRNQTTQGIWLAECVGIEPFTIVMDLEGNDGKERGQVLIKINFMLNSYFINFKEYESRIAELTFRMSVHLPFTLSISISCILSLSKTVFCHFIVIPSKIFVELVSCAS